MVNHSKQTLSATENCKVIVFTIDSYWLALPITNVLKIINTPPLVNAKQNHLSLVHIGDRVLTILNLQQMLNLSNPEAGKIGKFLLILQLTTSEIAGIPLDEPPSLLELPLAEIRPIPESYRQSTSLKIASHVALVSQEETTQEVFLLDLEKLQIPS
ncbi:chemotaxis protein CheW [Oscillatoria salina]|uniref:chemotaxis protein CheW n=1 Tax=Oscillatoria salina TaxID=331517 RepID=UPI0013BCCC73|nr:chemotaxis protein CheW [Oscillatoria salina]MBZ8183271.1 chemotaxis protein CheW [Oscillatoria salina IIICB1]NET89241.1 chemotaxis protein CheW [Kamptonema sp. SIO1D9]